MLLFCKAQHKYTSSALRLYQRLCRTGLNSDFLGAARGSHSGSLSGNNSQGFRFSCVAQGRTRVAPLTWRFPGRPGTVVQTVHTCCSIWQRKQLNSAAKANEDTDLSSAQPDILLPKRFGNVAALFAHINQRVQPHHAPMSVSATVRDKRGMYQTTVTLHWPEKTTVAGRPAKKKKLAVHSAMNEAIRFLTESGVLSPSGEPVLFTREQIGEQMAALRTTPRLHVPESLQQETALLHSQLMRIHHALEDERAEEEAWEDVLQQPGSRSHQRPAPLFGGPDSEWPPERRQQRSDGLRAAVERRRDPEIPLKLEEAEDAQKQAQLPISSWRSQIVSAVDRHPVVIVRGETGSGKSTEVPQMLLDAWSERGQGADCNLVVTQPRRIAAVSLARRIAQLRREQLGETVGYQVRLDACPPRERGGVLFCTTGIVLARLHDNPSLPGVSHLVIDEVHERSVQTDMLLLLVRRLLRQRPELRVLLMSASVDTKLLSQYFDNAPVIDVPGRVFPVRQHFLEELGPSLGVCDRAVVGELRRRDTQERPLLAAEAVAGAVEAVCRTRPPGAVLVFLEGMAEIKQVEDRLLRLLPDRQKTWVLPVSGRLSSQQQQRIFSRPPPGVRKVVLATNVAETGITVDDVCYVVDSGAAKQARLDPETGISCLRTEWVSQANVAQRRGRAGRVRPGESYHLYSRRRLGQMEEYETPELQRVPLETVVLNAKHLCPDLPAEEFLSSALQPPPLSAVRAALDQLRLLQMLGDEERLTALGELAARFELHPRQVRLLAYGVMLRCIEPALTMVGWEMSGREPYDQALERRPELLQVKRDYSSYSDAQVAIRLFRNFSQELESSQRRYCEDNMLFFNGMRTVTSLVRMVRGQLATSGLAGPRAGRLDSPHHHLNEHAADWNMVHAAHVAGHVRNVARVKRGTVRKGRVRSKDVVVLCSEGVADAVGDSVNRKPSGQRPFLAYGSAFFSTQRRRLVLRDTVQMEALPVALFYGDSTQTLAVDEETGLQQLRISCSGEFPIYVEAEPSVVRCIRELRSVLHYTVWHQLESLRSPANHSRVHRDVTDLHANAVRLLAEMLSGSDSPR